MLDEIFKYAPLPGAFVSPLSEKSVVPSLMASGGELGMKVAFWKLVSWFSLSPLGCLIKKQ